MSLLAFLHPKLPNNMSLRLYYTFKCFFLGKLAKFREFMARRSHEWKSV